MRGALIGTYYVPDTVLSALYALSLLILTALRGRYRQKLYSLRGFPGGAVVGSPPASAGDTSSGPGPGGSHMPRSSWAREPRLLSLHVWSLCSATGEAAIMRGPRTAMKSGPTCHNWRKPSHRN